jgi:hypothetical protein
MKRSIALLLTGAVLGALAFPVASALADDERYGSNHPITKIAESLGKISNTLERIEKKLK